MPIASTTEFLSTKFDYVVVGGGTTGLALAVRLSEDPNVTVGVIEAGAYDPNVPEINVPGLMARILANPKYDWCFFSTPQSHAQNRLVFQPRGKALGGSSMLNFQCLFRPTREEIDVLEELGNKGWNWADLLNYFKKSETFIPHPISEEDAVKYAIKPNPDFHGTSGPMIKSLPVCTTKLHTKVLDALETLKVPRNPESNGGDLIGAFTGYTSIDPRIGQRSYSASAYYEPNKERKNLLVLTEAQTTKIILEDGLHGLQRCAGVEFVKDGATHKTQPPSKDVIISAGTFLTPQILELSGIGNKEILAKHGIHCKVDLPGVGEHLQDHVFAPTIAETVSEIESLDSLNNPEVLAEHMELYKQQKGFLAGFTSPCFAYVPARTVSRTPEEVKSWHSTARAHCEKTVASASNAALRDGLKKQFDIQSRWFDDAKQPQIEILHFPAHFPVHNVTPAAGKTHTSILCALSHPFSRGSVHVTSADPLTPPAIDCNYFSNPADLDVLARGIDFSLRLWETDALKGAVVKIVMPAGVSEIKDDKERIEKIKEYIKEFVAPVYHPVGTAAMMKKEEGGVVDPELKVYGTSNVRVADLSILPLELSIHVQSAAYAIAEKAADIIRNSHY